MKCIVLAAGFATRLRPLTDNFPKPLLPIGNATILDFLFDAVADVKEIDEFVVVSNAKFVEHFRQWSRARSERIVALDDGAVSNETRRGAVADLLFALRERQIDDDLLVLAGDNLVDFSFQSLVDGAREKGASCVMRYFESDLAALRKRGVAEIDQDGRILNMTEKPENPKAAWCVPPFYFYRREDLSLVRRALDEGCDRDAPGSLVAWLCKRARVYAIVMPGRRVDVGDLASYEAAQREWSTARRRS